MHCAQPLTWRWPLPWVRGEAGPFCLWTHFANHLARNLDTWWQLQWDLCCSFLHWANSSSCEALSDYVSPKQRASESYILASATVGMVLPRGNWIILFFCLPHWKVYSTSIWRYCIKIITIPSPFFCRDLLQRFKIWESLAWDDHPVYIIAVPSQIGCMCSDSGRSFSLASLGSRQDYWSFSQEVLMQRCAQ